MRREFFALANGSGMQRSSATLNGKESINHYRYHVSAGPQKPGTPADVASWMTILGIAKEYLAAKLINHLRRGPLRRNTIPPMPPPDAAFTAADLLACIWRRSCRSGGRSRKKAKKATTSANATSLFKEGFRILREYGHHPSFLWLSLGNELWGSKDVLNRMMRAYREADDTKLYSSGANNYQFVPDVLDEEMCSSASGWGANG